MAEDHFRLVVAAVVDDRIVNTAKGCARIEGGILDIERLHKINDDIRTVLRLFLFHSGHWFTPPQIRGSALHTKKSAAWLGLHAVRSFRSISAISTLQPKETSNYGRRSPAFVCSRPF